MSIKRKSVQALIPVPVHEALGRLCRAYDRSQSKMVEMLIVSADRGLPDDARESHKPASTAADIHAADIPREARP